MTWGNAGWVQENGWYRNKVAGAAATAFDTNFGSHALSNSNLTVTNNGTTTISRTLASHTTGKYYWEFTIGAAGNFIVGICSATEVGTTFVSSDGKSAGAFAGSGWLGSGLSGTTSAPAVNTPGSTYGMSLDATNKLIWLRDITGASNWNAPAVGDPTAGLSGFGCDFSACTDLGTAAIFAAVTCANSGDNATFNFAGPFVGTVPSLYGIL